MFIQTIIASNLNPLCTPLEHPSTHSVHPILQSLVQQTFIYSVLGIQCGQSSTAPDGKQCTVQTKCSAVNFPAAAYLLCSFIYKQATSHRLHFPECLDTRCGVWMSSSQWLASSNTRSNHAKNHLKPGCDFSCWFLAESLGIHFDC